ncbi:hypothetical protein [Sulfurovum sp. NBC37-1]|uniref:hypothetical protein n=1 Tax=Sulfurovum sp. (strain NBC37-1) TaxID=387093 RepID=UPI00015877B3|nr:hypothetical protein [Sulfurovum sp. NBC37-1]BAF71629.1 hypothetical protein SUN_0670 [Sulfurovum sp. NBC37-1]
MKNLIPYLAILLVIVYAFYNASFRKDGQTSEAEEMTDSYRKHIQKHTTLHTEEELAKIHTVGYTKAYITSVINHGSKQFDFPGGEMEAGFVSHKDAPKIACYVLSLSGQKCKEPYPKDAAMFYTSVCGGCHGDDGKGLDGSYPDLTQKPLLGIEKREEFLKSLLSK